MDTTIIFVYCLSDEFVKSINYKEHDNCLMTNSEIITFAIISAMFFQCNYKKTALFFRAHKYFRKVLSLSRINKRLYCMTLIFPGLECITTINL